MNAAEIAERVANLDDAATTEVSKALDAGLDPVELLRAGVIRGLELIGQKFEAGEYFLPELMMSARAMQAAMAGEAGRGFAVVADEVQRLAERSSNATKQIEALVKTIQADTNEAVSSMESSTSEVVSGARLAEEQYGAVGRRDALDSLVEFLHRWAASHQLPQGVTAPEPPLKKFDVSSELAPLQSLLDSDE